MKLLSLHYVSILFNCRYNIMKIIKWKKWYLGKKVIDNNQKNIEMIVNLCSKIIRNMPFQSIERFVKKLLK